MNVFLGCPRDRHNGGTPHPTIADGAMRRCLLATCNVETFWPIPQGLMPPGEWTREAALKAIDEAQQ